MKARMISSTSVNQLVCDQLIEAATTKINEVDPIPIVIKYGDQVQERYNQQVDLCDFENNSYTIDGVHADPTYGTL